MVDAHGSGCRDGGGKLGLEPLRRKTRLESVAASALFCRGACDPGLESTREAHSRYISQISGQFLKFKFFSPHH